MKKKLAWHEECLRNVHDAWIRARESEIQARMECIRLANEVAFRQRQIMEARKQGKEEFDADKFLSKERPNPSNEALRKAAGEWRNIDEQE